MGISGLLPFLKDAIENVNISQFEGCTVAVDTYCWIYRGAFSCAEQLALNQPTNGHIKYVLKYVQKLLEWNIKPIMVFDGCCLPSKKKTEVKRRESKDMYRKKAAQCLAEGKKNEARECFQRCIEVTQKMAHEVIQALHKMGVDVIIAPYEADAQLTYLNKMNIAQIIITEDSDLILFGCKKVLYKLDMNGTANLLDRNKIDSITQFESADNFERFRWMCILSGCDYLDNLPGIGLGKAKKLLKQTKKTDIESIFKVMAQQLKMPNLSITQEYIENFKKADKTFKYQIVFDPLQRKLVSLREYECDVSENENLTYAGCFYDDQIALQLALGNLDVNTKESVDDFDPAKWMYKPPPKYTKNTPKHMKSIWSDDYQVNDCLELTLDNQKENLLDMKNINRVNTKGLERVIEVSCKTSKIQQLNKSESIKRKSECTFESASFTESVKTMQSPKCFATTPKEKKFKVNEIDIDNMLNEYSINMENDEGENDGVEEASPYFSFDKQVSPVLKKPSQSTISQSSNNSQMSVDGNSQSLEIHKLLPFEKLSDKYKMEHKEESVFERMEIETKETLSTRKTDQNTKDSPIVIKKSSQKSFEKSKNEKFKDGFILSESSRVRKDIAQTFDKYSYSSSDGKENLNVSKVIETTKQENGEDIVIDSSFEKKDILADIEKLVEKSKPPQQHQPSASNNHTNSKNNKKTAKNAEAAKGTRPISQFFTKFEYTKTTTNKFTN